ncbi:hypothetical protein G6M86_28025 (plasmid) [Agrobacterium tumefaciens]|uniref:Uncharacterized protein n=1 Tax=Agrobacterium tumefaciens TaxID=358 RepID=A0AAJ4TDH0_AGRTU|nr:hypothetical protein G6M86_28025 [Agrobacterium tumefaciens]
MFGARARRIAPQRERGGKQPRVAILKNAFYLRSQGGYDFFFKTAGIRVFRAFRRRRHVKICTVVLSFGAGISLEWLL